MKNLFDAWYKPHASEREAFGPNWCGPEQYGEWEKHLVAVYEPEEDGSRVEVFCEAAPARFYTIKVFPRTDYDGNPVPGCTIGTGSSQHQLAADIAKAVSEGMLVIKVEYPDA